MSASAATAPPVLSLERVSVRLGGRPVLREVDLAVRPGRFVGLVGLNGAGKTTSLRVQLGLLPPDSGQARVFGSPARRVHRAGRRLGASLHGAGLDPALTVRQNLRWHARLAGTKVGPGREEEVVAALGLEALADRRVAGLSQGERRRAGLARALLLEPEALVLDEPLANLDPGAVHAVLDLLARARRERGAALLVSSHQLDLVERSADDLVLLHRGRVLLAGSTRELLERVEGVWIVDVRPPALARGVLRRLAEAREGASVEGPLASPHEGAERYRLVGFGDESGRLARALVEAGAELLRLAPERRSLDDLFQRAVAEAEAGRREEAA